MCVINVVIGFVYFCMWFLSYLFCICEIECLRRLTKLKTCEFQILLIAKICSQEVENVQSSLASCQAVTVALAKKWRN